MEIVLTKHAEIALKLIANFEGIIARTEIFHNKTKARFAAKQIADHVCQINIDEFENLNKAVTTFDFNPGIDHWKKVKAEIKLL